MPFVNTGRKSGFIQRGGRSVRATAWVSLDRAVATLAGAPQAVLLQSGSAALLAMRPFTIVRTRGVFHIESDQSIASEVYHVAYAGAVVSDQALAIGITAVPTPETDRGSDLFFMYEETIGSFVFGDATGFDEQGGMFRTFDSKAMRKVNDDQDVAFVAETVTGSAGAIVRVAGRVLLKLH